MRLRAVADPFSRRRHVGASLLPCRRFFPPARTALRSLGLALFVGLAASRTISPAENPSGGAPGLSLQRVRDQRAVVAWKEVLGLELQFEPPLLRVADGDSTLGLAMEAQLASQTCADDRVELRYALSVDDRDTRQTGTYRVTYTLAREAERTVLRQESDLTFEEPLRLDVSVEHPVQVLGKQPAKCTFPLRNGVVTNVVLGSPETAAAYFTLGRGATSSKGHELAMPVVGLGFDGDDESSLAVATDPYCGAQFRLTMRGEEEQRGASITLASTYKGTLVPVKREARTCVFVSHQRGVDGMLASFYDTIPEIEPGAAWIHDVQLNYFDYLGKQGRAWFADIEKLAEKVPAEKRKAVVVNLHGWYDYLGRYAFDRNSRKLEDEWLAFPKTRKIPMSKAEIHRRVRLAKDLGFRVVLYFADGLNSDSGMPDFPEHWLFKDEHGNLRKGWTDPSTGVTCAMDPSNPEVRRFFLDYVEAVLDEYGREIDGLGWDETQYIAQEKLSSVGGALAYADRNFMRLVADITQLVGRRRTENPDLVFLTSDCVGCWGDRHVPYALVSHGTYQDTACNPVAWPPGLLPNYRNCLWSCNWSPLTNRDWNRIAAEEYGLPQGLSCGYGDDVGPAEMSEEMLDEVIGRFLKRVEEGGRRRYLTEPTAHVVANRYGCTTREDAAGGCDAVKTGTWGFCTEREANPWWQVDLGRSLPLDRVVIYNRCDGNVEARAARLKVLLSSDGDHWTEAYQHDGTAFFGYTDNKPLSVPLNRATARFVRIQLPATEYLHLDEVEVYEPESPTNLALKRLADQSSVSQWSTPGPAEPLVPK
ncbi:MAG: hypothetical protein A2V98_00620 [Planctomycetes bacterium RBG_16_64_12]|nr:MAG: hypothetical protein A2V98_00620 [Planctomycetes bacterium RBG_16_64_12]